MSKFKVELIKYAVAYTGEIWYKVTVNGSYVSSTCTQDYDQAVASFDKVVEYPEEKVIGIVLHAEV